MNQDKKINQKIEKIFSILGKNNYINGIGYEYEDYYIIEIYGINKNISKTDFNNKIYKLKIGIIGIKWIKSTIIIMLKNEEINFNKKTDFLKNILYKFRNLCYNIFVKIKGFLKI
jgi:hypothetical protein